MDDVHPSMLGKLNALEFKRIRGQLVLEQLEGVEAEKAVDRPIAR